MISFKTLKGTAGTIAAYVEHMHQSERPRGGEPVGYYADRAPSQWHGSLAAELGLSGEVDAADLTRLLDGEGFGLRNTTANRRLGTDLTFSAPKSVSIAALSGDGDSELIAAHDAAVKTALDYLEAEATETRRGAGGVNREKTGNFAAALFGHEDSRPVDGIADPTLHTHSVIANVTKTESGEYRTVSFDFGKDAERLHLADAIYKSELAAQAVRLGYEVEETEHGFELAGITAEQRQAFSRRTAQVAEREGKSRDATLASRETKRQIPREQQREEWAERAEKMGIEVGSLRSADRAAQAAAEAADEDGQSKRAAEALRSAVDHFAERDDVIRSAQVARYMLETNPGALTFDDARAAIEADEQMIRLDGDGDTFTTVQAVEREAWIVGRMKGGQGRAQALATDDEAAERIKAAEASQGFDFSDGQRAALAQTLTTTDQITGIRGAAGAGKTTAMKAAADNFKAEGFEVVGLAPSAKAAAELSEAGADDTRTLASQIAKQRANGPDTDGKPRAWIVDEAGMVSSADMQAFLANVGERDRVVMVGDQRQLEAVEAGKMFDRLQGEGMQTAEITEIRRQKDADQRRIAELFGEGRNVEAAEAAKEYMRPVETGETAADSTKTKTDKRREAIADETASRWLGMDEQRQAETLVLAPTNDTRERINQKIRAGLDEQAEQAGKPREQFGEVERLEKVDVSRAQRQRAGTYSHRLAAGDEIRIEQNGQTGRLADTDKKTNRVTIETAGGCRRQIDAAELAEARVWRAQRMELAAGDQLLFRANDKDHGIKNGEAGTVIGRQGDRITVEMHDEQRRRVEIDTAGGLRADYGFARTIHAAQGATVPHALVAGEASRVSTANAAYVAMSRQKQSVEVVTDNRDTLAKSWAKKSEKQGALEATETAEKDKTQAADPVTSQRIKRARERGQAMGERDAAKPDSQRQAEANRRRGRGQGSPEMKPGRGYAAEIGIE